MSIHEISLVDLVPNMLEFKRELVASYDAQFPWRKHGDVDEGKVFERKFQELATGYFAQGATVSARVMFDQYIRYKALISAVARGHSYDEDIVGGSFVGDTAAGAAETTVRHLDMDDTFATASWNQASVIGQMNIIPDDTIANNSVETAVANQETWIILGMYESLSGIPIHTRVQTFINDADANRLAQTCYLNQVLSNLLVFPYGTPFWVRESQTLDIDSFARAPAGVATGFIPFGVEILPGANVTAVIP